MSASAFGRAQLSDVYRRARSRDLQQNDKIVIFSDLHMGGGGRRDDFAGNAELFRTVLAQYYLTGEWELLLNGDVEELQRYRAADIRRQWAHVYELFDRFRTTTGLTRLVGNHDLRMLVDARTRRQIGASADNVEEGIRLAAPSGEVLILHGHQTARRYAHFNEIVHVLLRYIAHPLGIKNFSVAASSRKRFKVESHIYDFAIERGLIAVIGHTHRPLFQSMSKSDSIRFEIEQLCRKFPAAPDKAAIRERTARLKAELAAGVDSGDPASTLYHRQHMVPSLFNAGCVLGKRGMTCIELTDYELRLVYWYDHRRSQKYLQYSPDAGWNLDGTPYHRVVVRSENLDYIFARVRLLA